MNIFNTKNNIYVINILGTISYKRSSTSQNCCAYDVLEKLYNIEKDDRAKGIILRINSPGGTTGASLEIAEMIDYLRDNYYIISSIGDICTSGAYLIASQSSYIFATRMSLLGSIGVLMPCFNINEFSDKLGIQMKYLKSGKMKDIGNMFRDMTVEEEAYLNDILKYMHNEFILTVKNKRIIKNDEMFDGRFVDAKTALDNNLIDKFGNYYQALELLKRLIGDNEYNIIVDKPKNILLQQFSNFLTSSILNLLPSSLSINRPQAISKVF